MEKEIIYAGLVVRRQVRRLLLRLGIDFIEDKGLLQSQFFISKKDAAEVARYVPKEVK